MAGWRDNRPGIVRHKCVRWMCSHLWLENDWFPVKYHECHKSKRKYKYRSCFRQQKNWIKIIQDSHEENFICVRLAGLLYWIRTFHMNLSYQTRTVFDTMKTPNVMRANTKSQISKYWFQTFKHNQWNTENLKSSMDCQNWTRLKRPDWRDLLHF